MRESRGWATRLLFILTRCSRLVATEESSPFGSGGGGGHHGGGAAAYMTVQPRSKGPGRLRRFSGFPMLRNQLSLDPRSAAGAGAHAAGHAVSPRATASPLLRSATAPSRSLKDIMAGMHHLRIHDAGGRGLGGGAGGAGTQLSPMPESPSTSARSLSPSDMATPSHAARAVGLSPLGRSVVTALEAELEQAARAGTASVDRRGQQQQQQQQQAELAALRSQHDALQGPAAPTPQPGPAGSSGTASPMSADSPTKRQGIFKMLKQRFQSLRSASKEPPPAGAAAEEGTSHHSLRDGLQPPPFALTPQVGC